MFNYIFLLLFLKLIHCKIQIICPAEIEKFDCKCFIDFNYVSQQCPYGLTELDCQLDKKNLTHLLSKLSASNCYSGLNFEQVDLIVKNAFEKINLLSSAILSFKKVSKIDSFAFNHIKNPIAIRLDDDYTSSTSIIAQLEKNCFSNISNLTLIEFTKFKLLELKSDFFQNSIIETIFINRSRFFGFNSSQNLNTIVKNLFIKDSYTNGILNDEIMGYFYSLETVKILNSGIEIVLNTFEKYVHLKYLDLGLNSIKSIDFNNQLIKLSLFNNPVTNFKFIGDKLEFLNLDSTLIERFTIKAPNLQYISLADSKLITKYKNLNSLLDQIEINHVNDLKLIDITHHEVFIDSSLFSKDYLNKKDCLWNQIINRTFVKINKNHKCDCSTIYLYKNLDLTLEEIKSVPTCYAKLLIETKVKQREKECAFENTVNMNCSFSSVSTMMPSTDKTIDHELFERKTIIWEFTIPVIIGTFASSLIILSFFILKAKMEFSKKFDNIFLSNVLNRSNADQSEMNEILTISSTTISIRINENE